jgi:hypothetical protein
MTFIIWVLIILVITLLCSLSFKIYMIIKDRQFSNAISKALEKAIEREEGEIKK